MGPLRSILGISLLLWAGLPARASDYFLIVGGGPSAANNQVSLEKNVFYLQRILASAGVPRSQQICLFADGADPGRDLHEKLAPDAIPELHRTLATLSGNTRYLDFRFRNHQVQADGPATKKQLIETLRTLRDQLRPEDRLFIYVTAHGGRGKPANNARLYLWGNETISVRELAAELDRFDARTTIVLVMVQCYSGGFANVVFRGGDPQRELCVHRRCGFFATVQTRAAAGCTPEVEEENYREYSSSFWAALYGKTRTGRPVPSADYDGDGTVSLSEAHAYVLTHSETIDIPVKTSEALLRKYSRLGRPSEELHTLDGSLEALLELAGPADRYVLQTLAEEFSLDAAAPVASARKLLDKLQSERQAKLQRAARLRQRSGFQRRRLWNKLTARWPELVNPWRPDMPALLAAQREAILEFVRSQSHYTTLKGTLAEIERLETEARQAECRWAKVRRFLRVAENVVLAQNLPAVAEQQIVQTYERLCELEAQPFLAFPTVNAAAAADSAETGHSLTSGRTEGPAR